MNIDIDKTIKVIKDHSVYCKINKKSRVNLTIEMFNGHLQALEQQQDRINELENVIEQALDCHKKHGQLLYFDVNKFRIVLPEPLQIKK